MGRWGANAWTRQKKARESDAEHDHEKNGEVAVEAAHNDWSGFYHARPGGHGRVGATRCHAHMTAAEARRGPAAAAPVPAQSTATSSIVGGGPAGAAAAYWLASSGIDVLVVEKKRYPR